MNDIQTLTDKAAISLSLLCALHCLVFPWAIIFLPSLAALPLEGEALHLWLLGAIIPTSAFALTMGCKKHKRYRIAILGTVGLSILVAALFVGEGELAEIWEKTLTVIGAAIIAAGHLWNFRLCQHHDRCGCSEHADQDA